MSLSRSYLTAHDTEIDRLGHVCESLAVARGTRIVESLFNEVLVRGFRNITK